MHIIRNYLINNLTTLSPIFALSLIFLVPTITQAGVYKWVDENGKIHFGDRPGNSGNKEKVDIKIKQEAKPKDIDTAKRLEEEQKLLEVMKEERLQREAQKAQALASQKKKDGELKQACAQAKDYKKNSEGARVYDLDENGERVFLSDEERDAEDEKLKKFIEENC